MPTSKKESEGDEMLSRRRRRKADAHLHVSILNNPEADAPYEGKFLEVKHATISINGT